MSTRAHHPACKSAHHVPAETAGEVAGAAIGVAVDPVADRSAWRSIGGAAAGLVAGEIIDRTVTPRCPTCRTVLRLIRTALT